MTNNKNLTEKAIDNLINFYDVSNASQLAKKINTTQGVISNWKTRNAIGAVVDKIAKEDNKALPHLFMESTKEEYLIKDSVVNNYNTSISPELLSKISNVACEYGMTTDAFIEATMLKEVRK